jgi:CBS domain containing-hemolysin-like protein
MVTTETALLILAAVLLAGSLFLSTLCYSLRNFARSRLLALARLRSDEARFGRILKQDETALAACEKLLAGATVLAVVFLAFWRYGGAGAIPWWRPLVDALVLACAAVVGLVILPWSISRVYGESVVFGCWPLTELLTSAARPLAAVARLFDTFMHRVAGRRDPAPETVETFTDEIQSVVDEGEREGLLESRAGRMIQRIMELREYDVRAVMTPRIDMVSVPAGATLEEARRVILESGHSRVPVVGDSPDDIQGILYARDLLEQVAAGASVGRPANTTPVGRPAATADHEVAGPATTASPPADARHFRLTDIARHPNYVPETTTIDRLLERMKRERFHIAVVLDEYGGVTGLVTMEDILEEIVGDIEDEFDEAQAQQIHRVDDDTTEVDARVHIDELNELFDYALPDDADYDTIGGFVFSELGRIPRRGETFTWRNLRLTVLEADKRTVIKVRIQLDHTLVPAGGEEG